MGARWLVFAVRDPIASMYDDPGINDPIELRPFIPSHVGTAAMNLQDRRNTNNAKGMSLIEYISRDQKSDDR